MTSRNKHQTLPQKILGLVVASSFLVISIFPQASFSQAPITPLGPGLDDIPTPLDLGGFDETGNLVNSSEALIRGGQEAIEQCLRQPLGKFQGILGGEVTQVATEFLGAGGLLNTVGNASADIQTVLNVASTIANIAGPLLAGPLGGQLGKFFGGFEQVQDNAALKAINSSGQFISQTISQATSLQADSSVDIIEILKGTQVSDNCIDQAVYLEAQQMLFSLTNDAVDWIQSGFEGGQPGFVTNLEQRGRDIAAAEWLRFLNPDNTQFQNICQAFRSEVVLAVRQSYNDAFAGSPTGVIPELDLSITEQRLLEQAIAGNQDDEDCLLTQITGSNEATEAFLEGDFSAGGWDAWFTLFNDPGSNPNTAVGSTSRNLQEEIDRAVQTDLTELEWSGGFLSDRVCSNGTPVGFGGLCADGSNPIIVTPGATVATIISELIASPIRRLELADEIGEVVENIGKTILGGILPTGGSSSAPGLRNLVRTDFTDAFAEASTRTFAGEPSGGVTLDKIQEQSRVEDSLYSYLFEAYTLQNSRELENAAMCIPQEPEIEDLIIEFNQVIDSMLPGSEDALQNRVDYEPPGVPVKVDWAGNDLNWEYDKYYGLETCTNDIYSASEGRPRLRRFLTDPQFSYIVPENEDRWKIFVCAPRDASDNENDRFEASFFEIDYRPLATRSPENRQKINWEGQPFDWKYYDPFQKNNAYGIQECDERVIGQESYSVGRPLGVEWEDLDNFYYYPLDNPFNRVDPLQTGQRSAVPPVSYDRCRDLSEHLGFDVCGAGDFNPSSYGQQVRAIERATEFLINFDPTSPLSENWYRSSCYPNYVDVLDFTPKPFYVLNDIVSRIVYHEVLFPGINGSNIDFMDPWSPSNHPIYSDYSYRPLEIVLGRIFATQEGLDDFGGSLDRAELVKIQAPNDFGIRDLTRELADGELVSQIIQRYQALLERKYIHLPSDVTTSRNGYRLLLPIFQEILELSAECQDVIDPDIGNTLSSGDLQVNGIDNPPLYPENYEGDITLSWETNYCTPGQTVSVYRNLDLIATGEEGVLVDRNIVTTPGTYNYSQYCGPRSNSDNLLDRIQITFADESLENNDPPIAISDNFDAFSDQEITFDVLTNDYDPDGDAIGVTSFTQPSNGGLRRIVSDRNPLGDSVFVYTPNADFIGTDRFTYVITDNIDPEIAETDSAQVLIRVTNRVRNDDEGGEGGENDNPIARDDNVATRINTAVSINVLANDSDPSGNQIGVRSYSQPTNGRVAQVVTDSGLETNPLVYTPSADFQGTDRFNYVAQDEFGNTDQARVTVIVGNGGSTPGGANNQPNGINDQYATDINTSIRFNVLANDSDPDGDAIGVQSFTAPTNGNLQRVITDQNQLGDGEFVYTPNRNFTGSDSFTYRVTDGELTDQVRVSIRTNDSGIDGDGPGGDNDRPVGNLDVVNVKLNTPRTFNVLLNDRDGDGDSLTIESFTEVSSGALSQNRSGNGGEFTYTPDSAYLGPDSFTYRVTDGELSDTGRVIINVTTDGGDTGGGENPAPDSDDPDGGIDDNDNDPDGGVNTPETNPNDGIDNDGDGCIDDSLEDPDGSCNDGGDYVGLGINNGSAGTSSSQGVEYATPEANTINGIDDDNDGYIDDGRNNPFGSPETGSQAFDGIDNDGDGFIDDRISDTNSGDITDLPIVGDDQTTDGDDNVWWWILLIILLIITIGGWWWRRRKRNQSVANANSAARLRQSALK